MSYGVNFDEKSHYSRTLPPSKSIADLAWGMG